MIEREQTLAAYERAWAQQEASGIRAELERCFKPDSTYVSPLTDVVRGVDGLTGLILDFPVMFPGAQVRPTSPPDIHHDVAYFTWRLSSTTRIRTMGRDYGRTLDGVDFVEFDSDGLIRRIIAFYGVDRSLLQQPTAQPTAEGAKVNGYETTSGPSNSGRGETGGPVLDLTTQPSREPLVR